MKQIQSIDRTLSKIFRALAYAGGAVSCAMMLLSVANVIMRAIFRMPIYGTIEIVSYGALLTAAFAFPQNEMDDGNATMTLIVDAFKPRVKAVFLFIAQIFCCVFYGFVTYRYFTTISYAAVNHQMTATLEMPMSIFNACMFGGFLFLTLASLLKAVRHLCFVITGSQESSQETETDSGKEENAI